MPATQHQMIGCKVSAIGSEIEIINAHPKDSLDVLASGCGSHAAFGTGLREILARAKP